MLPLPTENDQGGGSIVLLKPPAILVKLGYVSSTSYWKALMAMYGLRQSPKTWGDHRDECFHEMSWKTGEEEFYFESMTSEPKPLEDHEEREGLSGCSEGTDVGVCG